MSHKIRMQSFLSVESGNRTQEIKLGESYNISGLKFMLNVKV
jgi:hypothetical protein